MTDDTFYELAIFDGRTVPGIDYIVHTAECGDTTEAEIVEHYRCKLDVYTAGYGGTCADVYEFHSAPWVDECHKRGLAGVMWHGCAINVPDEVPAMRRRTVVEWMPGLINDVVGGDGRSRDVPSSALVRLFDDMIIGNADERRVAAGKLADVFARFLVHTGRIPAGHYYDGVLGRYYCDTPERHASCEKLPSLVDSATMFIADPDRNDSLRFIRPTLFEENHAYAAREIGRSMIEAVPELAYVPSAGLPPSDDRTIDDYMRAAARTTNDPSRFVIIDNWGREYAVSIEPVPPASARGVLTVDDEGCVSLSVSPADAPDPSA